MRPLLALSLLLLLAAPAAAQETRIAAVVNDDIVSLNDLSNRMLLVMRSSGMEDTKQNRDRVSSQVLRSLIDERLCPDDQRRHHQSLNDEQVSERLIERPRVR